MVTSPRVLIERLVSYDAPRYTSTGGRSPSATDACARSKSLASLDDDDDDETSHHRFRNVPDDGEGG